jgi:predicted permease
MVDGQSSPVSSHVYRDLVASDPPFVSIAPVRPVSATVSLDGAMENVTANRVTEIYFDTLGVRPALGRMWTPGESDAVVISWSLWHRVFGGDPDAVGRSLQIDGRPRVVTGVMSRAFVSPYWTEVHMWLPLDMATTLADPRGRRQLTVIARRKADLTQEQAASVLDRFAARMQQEHPTVHARQTWVAPRLRDEITAASGPALIATAAAAALLLFIVGANIAGLSASRAVALRREVAIKAALGAGRGRLLHERLVESVVLAAVGSAAGLWLAQALAAAAADQQSQFLDRLGPIDSSLAALWPGAALGLVVGVMAATLPHLGRWRPGASAIRASRGGTGDKTATRLRSGLAVGQIAMTLALLVGAGLLVRTVLHLNGVTLGFDSTRLASFNVILTGPRYADESQHLRFEREVVARLKTLPGVADATASVGIPVSGGMGAALNIFGTAEAVGPGEIHYMSVAPDFMTTYRIPLRAGRLLEEADGAGAEPVVVINETMARTYWPQGDAIGSRVRIGPGGDTPWITIVGIVGDVRQHGPARPLMPTAFGTTMQYSWPRRHFTVRFAGAVSPSASDLRAVISSIDPDIALGTYRTFDSLVERQTGRQRVATLALASFGLVAVVLCAFGLYAVLALTSGMRRREYAVRIALGASLHGVRWLVVRQALVLGAGGVAIGLAAAAGATRALQGLLHGVTALDATTYAGAVVILFAMALLATWLPARRAGRVNPVEVLHTE